MWNTAAENEGNAQNETWTKTKMFREKCVNVGQFICTQERELNIHKIKVPEEDNMNSGREQTFTDIF